MAKEKKSSKDLEKAKKAIKSKAKPEKESKAKKRPKGDDEDDAKSKKDKTPKIDLMSMYSESMDVISKRQGFESSSLDVAPAMSTGLLCYDLLLGGGIFPCMMTGAGNEQCAKTTLALMTMAAAINENIPIIAMADFEGSTKNSKPYVASILRTCGVKLNVDQVFGKRDSEGKWKIKPRVRYRAEVILEKFYDWVSEILRELPDKKFVENEWWLVFDEKNKRHKAMAGEFVDEAMTRKYGNGLWVKAPDDKIQAIIFVDSYTAMQPKVKDEEEISNQLSVKASAFSKQLERVKGRMAEKMVTIYGLNHLRSNPMAMFGPKEDEKGGNALKQFSDIRVRQTSRSLSAAPFKAVADKKFNEAEASVEFEGNNDTYRYVHLRTNKNKLATPDRETFIRIWVRDGQGQARGIDPVFDTIYYLKQTGQLSGNRKAFKLNLDGLGKTKNALSWSDIKSWVLGDKEMMTKISKKAGFAPMSLRKFCFKQMAKGKGDELYAAVEASKGKQDDNDDE